MFLPYFSVNSSAIKIHLCFFCLLVLVESVSTLFLRAWLSSLTATGIHRCVLCCRSIPAVPRCILAHRQENACISLLVNVFFVTRYRWTGRQKPAFTASDRRKRFVIAHDPILSVPPIVIL